MAIGRVETITGGASAAYGADTIAGIINFIMKKNFQGLQFDGQIAERGEGDGNEYQVTALMGANLADNKGNVMLTFSTNRRQGSDRLDRSWFRDKMKDPSDGGDEFFPTFSGFDMTNPTKFPSQASYDAIFGQRCQRAAFRRPRGSTSTRMARLSRDSFRASLRPVPIASRKTSPAPSGRRTRPAC